MSPLELSALNVLSPIVLAFGLGVLATLARSDLRFPDDLYTALSIYLLLAIGLKGGAELSGTPMGLIWRAVTVTLLAGALTPFPAYAILRRLGGFAVADAAAIAAHYASVSVVTFTASLAFLERVGTPYEGFMPALVALLEAPGIVVALALARTRMDDGRWHENLREIVAGRSVLLLLGGLAIGYLSGARGLAEVAPFFVDPFRGALGFLMLEMGMVAAKRLPDLRRVGLFLVAFGVGMPVAQGLVGVGLATLAGLSVGGATAFGVMMASASYIAAPAAVRLALPQANPSYYLTASLVVTFPFNLTVGIPLYYAVARLVHSWIT